MKECLMTELGEIESLFRFCDKNFGNGVSGPEECGSDPKNGAVSIVGGHDVRPEVAADAGCHREKHDANGSDQPPILLFQFRQISTVTKHDARRDSEGDYGEAAD